MEESKDNVRPSMMDFWDEHSQDASIQEMMLDYGAEELSKDELPEILSYLPQYNNLDVVELGAGIGRFTSHIAVKANKVLAVDFVEKFIEKNKDVNKNFTNIDYLVKDVMDMSLEKDGWDVVFSNWLYMYLDNDELTHFLQNTLSWLRMDGYMFCRESCNHQSGNKERGGENPTYYRDPLVYEALFSGVTIPTEDGQADYGFETVLSRPVNTYIRMKQNENQLIWLVQKVRQKRNTGTELSSLTVLKERQKSEVCSIHRRERLVGRGFIRTGGLSITKNTAEMLHLKADQRVLDVDCGIGGFSIHVAKEYGVYVTGCDVSSTRVSIARERAKEADVTQVDFEVASITRRVYVSDSFDAIHWDSFGNVRDKLSLLKRFFNFLTAGGKLLISEFCIDEHMEDIDLDNDVFEEESDQNSNATGTYDKVHSVDVMLQMLRDAGFVKVETTDKTDDILRALEIELQAVKEQPYAECVETLAARREIVDKLKSGNSWTMFYAEKP